MRTSKAACLILATALALMLGGCGSNRDSDGGTTGGGTVITDPVTGIAYVSAGVCVECHEGFSWSAEAVSSYLASKHVVHSASNNAGSDPACLECHDPLGDGPSLESRLDPANVPAAGLAAVGCENCHGPGGKHYGVGPIPSYNPNFEVCGQCHNALPDSHIPHHPLANNILDNYKLSAHYTQDVRNTGTCMRCHSDEGYRTYIDQTTGLDAIALDTFMAGKAAVGTDPIQCRTCHDPHSGGMRVEATMIHRLNGASINGGVDVQVFSSQFNLCTSCHQAFVNATAFDETTGLFTYELAGNLGYHDDLLHPTRVITDTHFPDPVNNVVGYNINAAAENACTNCHDPHAASKFEQVFAQGITEEWANEPGFHGDYKGPGFEHGCTPCHSPEGLIELTVGGAYAEASTPVGVIACVACHDLQVLNATNDGFELGDRRPSPEFAFDNARTLYAAALAADPNTTETLATVEGLGDNALCMTCHQGRESTASVNAKIASGPGPYSFTNIHYLAAAATLFGNQAKGAYEYDGKSYSSKFEHVDSNDLCIECHSAHSGQLAIDVNHATGALTCNACHLNITATPSAPSQTANATLEYELAVSQVRDIRMNGSLVDYDGDGNTTEGMYYEVAGLQAQLLARIQYYATNIIGIGIEYDPAVYPYFFKAGLAHESANSYKDFDAKLLKAGYNYQVSIKDPGSYAHNGTYIIEILYDSIEDLGGDVSALTRDAAGHFNAADEPFRHWDGDGEMSLDCARCHSSEGAAAFFANGTVTTADFKEYTKGISAGLACEACHTAPFVPAGTTRAVTSVTFPSGVTLDNTVAANFFADPSPLCMDCHQGRSSTQTVNDRLAVNNFGFSNIHYFAAAASLFGTEVKGGYEYAAATSSFTVDPVYAGQNTFPLHPTTLQTCAGCHMQEGGNVHTFTPDVARCIGCHGGTSFETLGGSPSSNFDDIAALKAQLLIIITNSGVTHTDAYPYFSGLTTAPQVKAAYNWQVADKEPCGYIHNGDYIKQLLYDSIVDLSTALNAPVTPVVARP